MKKVVFGTCPLLILPYKIVLQFYHINLLSPLKKHHMKKIVFGICPPSTFGNANSDEFTLHKILKTEKFRKHFWRQSFTFYFISPIFFFRSKATFFSSTHIFFLLENSYFVKTYFSFTIRRVRLSSRDFESRRGKKGGKGGICFRER